MYEHFQGLSTLKGFCRLHSVRCTTLPFFDAEKRTVWCIFFSAFLLNWYINGKVLLRIWLKKGFWNKSQDKWERGKLMVTHQLVQELRLSVDLASLKSPLPTEVVVLRSGSQFVAGYASLYTIYVIYWWNCFACYKGLPGGKRDVRCLRAACLPRPSHTWSGLVFCWVIVDLRFCQFFTVIEFIPGKSDCEECQAQKEKVKALPMNQG